MGNRERVLPGKPEHCRTHLARPGGASGEALDEGGYPFKCGHKTGEYYYGCKVTSMGRMSDCCGEECLRFVDESRYAVEMIAN